MGAEKIMQHWLVRREQVKRLQESRRHGKAQALPLSFMEGGQKPDPGRNGDMGAKGQNVERTLEVSTRNYVAPTEQK